MEVHRDLFAGRGEREAPVGLAQAGGGIPADAAREEEQHQGGGGRDRLVLVPLDAGVDELRPEPGQADDRARDHARAARRPRSPADSTPARGHAEPRDWLWSASQPARRPASASPRRPPRPRPRPAAAGGRGAPLDDGVGDGHRHRRGHEAGGQDRAGPGPPGRRRRMATIQPPAIHRNASSPRLQPRSRRGVPPVHGRAIPPRSSLGPLRQGAWWRRGRRAGGRRR